jgi:hypothetical protein
MTIYIESKTNSAIDILLTSDETKSFVSQIQYHTALGTYDQNALMNLQSEKQTLENQKQKLEDDKLEIETLTEQIKIQKENLEKDKENLSAQKVQKNQFLQNSQVAAEYYKSQYDNLTDEEIKKEAQLDYILQQLIDSATKPKGYVVKGQKIAVQASNGCSTGPHTHLGLAVDGVWSNPCSYLTYYNFTWIECGGDGSIRYPYNGTFYMSQYYKSYHQALDLVAGSDKYVYASHDGYFFEENAPCSNSWCRVGCKTSTNPCAKVCEDISCKKGKTTIYCHVNFL